MTLAKPIILTPLQIASFHSKYTRLGPYECWNWKLSTRTDGYGTFRFWDKDIKKCRAYAAHRVAYFLAFGDPPPHLQVCHTCDNKICCNPTHYFLGTHKDNAEDRERKGRGKPPKAEESGVALFTNGQVVEIKLRMQDGEKPRALAAEFGCNLQTIYDIKRGRTWNSVGPASDYKPIGHRVGEDKPAAKLTEDYVRQIRREYRAGGVTTTALGNRYGVHNTRISEIVRGVAWRHVKDDMDQAA